MIMSTNVIGLESRKKLIVNGSGLKVFIVAIKNIGLESDYVLNHNDKTVLQK